MKVTYTVFMGDVAIKTGLKTRLEAYTWLEANRKPYKTYFIDWEWDKKTPEPVELEHTHDLGGEG